MTELFLSDIHCGDTIFTHALPPSRFWFSLCVMCQIPFVSFLVEKTAILDE